jgi:GNAT superfamily N-acetyltransferase
VTAAGVREILPAEIDAQVEALTDLLVDAVASGASVSFMASTTRAELETFWRAVAGEVRGGAVRLLAAFDGPRLCGAVTLRLATPPNQPHRADVTKLLVHRDARRRGVGRALMVAIEALARDARRTLLTLDTVTGGAAERLYTDLGWSRVGVIPDYALYPDGRPCATTVFFKTIA